MTNREIDRKGIQIPAPIRAIGDYKVPAKFVDGVSATLVVEVVADDASIELNKQMEVMIISKELFHIYVFGMEQY